MRLLRPVILERARPGTRVLTSTWDLGAWKPDKVSNEGTAIYLSMVPARVAGNWEWNWLSGRTELPVCRGPRTAVPGRGGRRARGRSPRGPESAALRGEDIGFNLKITLDGAGLTQHQFKGKVDGDRLPAR